MEHVFKHEQLPSGKAIMRHFGEDGSLIEEMHSYGTVDIAISFNFRAGVKVDETYFTRRGMVSRRSYEKARVAYADMPPADNGIEDGGAEILRLLAVERKQRNAEAKRRKPDADEAQKLDAFCSMVMAKGKREDAVKWIRSKNHTLGERTWTASKRLVERLSALGCVHIYACEIDHYDDGLENTGHLVVELPTEAIARGKILKAVDRLASETGYDGPFDDGQRFVYVKLD